jgi:hypothetical protein
MKISYIAPSRCETIGSWMLCEWDIRHHWDGPYRLFREHGVRLFGLEIVWVYLQVNDDY